MKQYSVRQVAKMAGVSVRTLHHYDRLGLLKPSIRTEARYRLYGEKELARLQQILFYKELDFSLNEILNVLEDPNFDRLKALQNHQKALRARQDRLSTLLVTIDKTILTLKGEQVMLTDEELYEGFPKGQAEAYRQEAVEKWGEEAVSHSEQKLRQLNKVDFEQLKIELEAVTQKLASLMHQNPTSEAVQQLIARHYALIQAFWGEAACKEKNRAEAYKGLAQLYVDDLRYTMQNGQETPAFAGFLNQAMVHFANTQL